MPLSVLVGRSGSDVRVGLDLVLEEGVYLHAAALDAAAADRRDELVAIARTLDQNSSTLAAIVGAVRGRQTQQTLLDQERGQTVDLLASVQGDTAKQAAAKSSFTADQAQIAAYSGQCRAHRAAARATSGPARPHSTRHC